MFYLFSGAMALLTPLLIFKGRRRAGDKPSNWFYMPETKDVDLEEIRFLFTLSVPHHNDNDTTSLLPRDELTASEHFLSYGATQNTTVEERKN